MTKQCGLGFGIFVIIAMYSSAVANGSRPIWNVTQFHFNRVMFYPNKLKGTLLSTSLESQEGGTIYIPEYKQALTLELVTANKRKAIIRNVYVYEKSWLVLFEEENKIGVQVSYQKPSGQIGVQAFTANWDKYPLK